MKYYIEMTLIPDAEISPFFIWSKLYTQIHLGLVEMLDAKQTVPIGVSFPEYAKDRLLGQKLRLFASDEATLQQLNLAKWLDRLADYVHISSIKPVPSDIQSYAVFSRYRPHFDIDKVAERFARHKNISFEAALEHCKNHKAPAKMLPFVQLKSQTNGQAFRLVIQQKVVTQAVVGSFSTYGLSQIATIPIF